MVPAALVGRVVDELVEHLEPGDAIIDGGNSYYRDDVDRAKALLPKGIHFVDVGTSGGVFGLERGFCLMIGGENEVVERLEPIFASLAPGRRLGPAHGRQDGRPVAGRAGLPPLRPERRRALREDGAQRHRVRDHGRLRRGPERAPQGGRRQARRRRGERRDHAAARARVLPVRHPGSRRGRGLAPRVGRRLLAPRPDRARPLGVARARRLRRVRLRLGRGALDGARRRRGRRARARAVERALRALLLPRRGRSSPTSCSPPCARSSAATPSSSIHS